MRVAKTKKRATKKRGLSKKKIITSKPPSAPTTELPVILSLPPVVALGASAGGLEALEAFFSHVPRESGVAFIVLQHLDPTNKGLLVELLQRKANMPIAWMRDDLEVRPNHVYVLPPNKEALIVAGRLHLYPPTKTRGLRLPIDRFFESLAIERRSRSIGVILSGMGSDGCRGMEAIKAAGGAVFVQSPESAKFNGMPQSAADLGLADLVSAVEQLPNEILGYLKSFDSTEEGEPPVEAISNTELDKMLSVVRAQTGQDFSEYKTNTLSRRVDRRMKVHHLVRASDYTKYLTETPSEVSLLFKEMLIGVTNFFRDPEVWEYLKTDILPELLRAQAPGTCLRAWTAACSTGEEAYSMAILFKEVLDQLRPRPNLRLQIFATDLDKEAIDRARTGIYPHSIREFVSDERLRRFFSEHERGYQVNKDIREMVIFAPQNVVMDPPFTKLHIVSCRNLLIYLVPELQKKLLKLFHYSLMPEGILVLGSASAIGSASNIFEPLSAKLRVFKRLAGGKPGLRDSHATAFNFLLRRTGSSRAAAQLSGTLDTEFLDRAEPRRPRAGSKSKGSRLSKKASSKLRSYQEEMQSAHEELRSTNEELQSTNEELQSTNEELSTSKEEMQSMNEELQTVNNELRAKVDELSWASSDMRNLLNSADIAILFLDQALCIRRFTTKASKIINIIPTDVGRPITDLSSVLLYSELTADVHEVLQSLVSKEKTIFGADQTCFQVRIIPYRTMENKIDGVVVTFSDVSAAKKLELALEQSAREARTIIEGTRDPFFTLGLDLRIRYLNQAARRVWSLTTAVVEGASILHIIPELQELDFGEICREVSEKTSSRSFYVSNEVMTEKHTFTVYPKSDGYYLTMSLEPLTLAMGEALS